MIISSQGFIFASVVANKRLKRDYEILVTEPFILNGQEYQVVIDGHHSLKAAELDNVNPAFKIATIADSKMIQYINDGKYLEFLEKAQMDSPYYDIKIKRTVDEIGIYVRAMASR